MQKISGDTEKKYWIVDGGSRAMRLICYTKSNWPVGQTVLRFEHHIFDTLESGAESEIMRNRALAAMAERLQNAIKISGANHVLAYFTGLFRTHVGLIERLEQLVDKRIEIHLLAPEDEARYSAIGAVTGIAARYGGMSRQDFVVIDVGGGSTEIGLVASSGAFRGGMSFPVGVSSSVIAPLYSEQLERIETFLDQQYHESYGLIPVASCGIASRTAGVILGLEGYDSQQIHGYELSREHLAEVSMNRIRDMPELAQGAGFLLRLLSALRSSKICVSESGWPSRLVPFI